MIEAISKLRRRSRSSPFSDAQFLTILSISSAGTLGWNAVSPALPAMAASLSVPDSQIGLVMTFFTLPTIVFVPITGLLADVYGRRVVVFPSLLLFGLAGVGVTTADTFGAVLGFRVLQGIAAAGVMPLTVVMLGDLFSGPQGSTAQGLRVTTNGFSNLVYPAVAGFLSGLAWSYPFLLYLLAFPAAVLFYLYVPRNRPPRHTNHISGAEVRRYAIGIYERIRDPNLSVLFVGGFARDFSRFGVITFVPLFAVQSLGGSFFEAGLVISAFNGVRLFTSPFAGHVSRLLSPKGALVGSLGVVAVGIGLIPLSTSVIYLGAIVAVAGIGDALFAPVFKNTVVNLAEENNRAGVVNALEIFKRAGQTASPALFGIVLTLAGFESIFLVAAAVSLSYVVLLVVVLDRHP